MHPPQTLWRISNYADLSGKGGLIGPARWHSKGRPIIYLATSPASALLETLVHLEISTLTALPRNYQLLRIQVADTVSAAAIEPDHLTDDWRTQTLLTRSIGDQWLRQGASALLYVPSAIVPFTQNVLLNPLHLDASHCQILSAQHYPFDDRLLRQTSPG
ncbi:RES domain-containing protein [Chitinivorax tropicus]|uniref:RES domain-containing protein n=1 Tax=Chitinivorax tropicus TaxID=714531 RepID=A0A840MKJ6_9PROT|nr:RES family NAD+ phosphorylase [Chitinivorax tropicus]MBB5017669.1 RES domain-containing protein [Chitinivorax tropicus]